MALSNEELLRKAAFTTGDLDGANEAPLSVEQVKAFLRLAITPQVMLPDVRTVTSLAAKWAESKIDFSQRVMRPGTEGERLAFSDRVKPGTDKVEISTTLIRGEVPISDEALEDQVEQAGFADTLVTMIADAVGRDVEDLMINGDTTSGEAYLALFDGWIELANDANTYAAAGDAQDYQEIMRNLLVSVGDKYKRDTANMRFYAPMRLVELYRDILAARGTPLGDLHLEGARELMYQGYKIVGVPLMKVTAGSPDVSDILFTHRQNLYAGWRRAIKLESFRDPREGATSFIVTARVDAKIGHTVDDSTTYAIANADSVNVEP